MLYPGWEDETYCIAAAEATCSGVPIITEGIGSLGERVTEEVTGLVRKGDEALAESSINLLTDDRHWLRLHRECVARRDSHSWDNIATKWISLIEKLTRSKG